MNKKQLLFYFDDLEDRKNLVMPRLNQIMTSGNGLAAKAKNYGQAVYNEIYICNRMMTEDNLNSYERLLTTIEEWLWDVL